MISDNNICNELDSDVTFILPGPEDQIINEEIKLPSPKEIGDETNYKKTSCECTEK